MDKSKHSKLAPGALVAILGVGIGGWALVKHDTMTEKKGVQLVVNTTADRTRFADIEYKETASVSYTVEDAHLEWVHRFEATPGSVVSVEAVKDAAEDSDAIFSCEIWVNDTRVAENRVPDDYAGPWREDPPDVYCIWLVV